MAEKRRVVAGKSDDERALPVGNPGAAGAGAFCARTCECVCVARERVEAGGRQRRSAAGAPPATLRYVPKGKARASDAEQKKKRGAPTRRRTIADGSGRGCLGMAPSAGGQAGNVQQTGCRRSSRQQWCPGCLRGLLTVRRLERRLLAVQKVIWMQRAAAAAMEIVAAEERFVRLQTGSSVQ